MSRARSQLHLQLGQEVIYVLMTLGLMTALILIANTLGTSKRPPEPECMLPGKGPCLAPRDLPGCARPGGGGCYDLAKLPECMAPGRGPCVAPRDLPDCARPGGGGCYDVAKLPECMAPGRGPCLSRTDIPAPPPQKPPILSLTEREGYRFATGKYDLSQRFRDRLEAEVVPEIIKYSAEYQANVVEVVGHTDSVAIRQANSTLDGRLVGYLSGGGAEAEVADNVGLGMMRAASVVRALRESSGLKNRGLVFLVMSAGQTILPDDRPVGPEKGTVTGDESRRRVEIRLRRSLSPP